MTTAIALKGQSLIDVAIRGYGNIESLVQIAKDNGLAVDSSFAAVQNVLIDETLIPVFAEKAPLKPEVIIPVQTKATVGFNQTLIDFCFQQYGTVERLVDVMADNQLSVGDDVVPGTELLIETTKIADNNLVAYLKKMGKKINTKRPADSSGDPAVLLKDDFGFLLKDDGGKILL